MTAVSALGLDARTYHSHALHGADRAWLETNCYVDLWIELCSALRLDPHAVLPFTLALDFEGDQWLFYKQPTGDLFDLYGMDVQELAIWRPLVEHAIEQVSHGRIVLVEVDAFHLPDTRGVSYRTTHTKTTIGIERVDRARAELGYFHNAGYYTLDGDDFAALFRPLGPTELAPYTEFVKLERVERRPSRELVTRSLALLRRHLGRAPKDNPFLRFAARFDSDLSALRELPPEAFHNYAFTTLRQCGSCCELAASYLRWLEEHGEPGLARIAAHFEDISTSAKAVQLSAARAVLRGRPIAVAPTLQNMALSWSAALEQLRARYST